MNKGNAFNDLPDVPWKHRQDPPARGVGVDGTPPVFHSSRWILCVNLELEQSGARFPETCVRSNSLNQFGTRKSLLHTWGGISGVCCGEVETASGITVLSYVGKLLTLKDFLHS